MEKGTYICNSLQDILTIEDVAERLDIVSSLFEEKERIKLNFCRIYGKRWSYIAGSEKLIVPEKKLSINNDYGLIIENNTLDDRTWDALIKCFRKLVETEDYPEQADPKRNRGDTSKS